MAWTGEDTKDVFKKVLGGLIAAAVVAIAYTVIEQTPWYYAAFLGIGLFVLVLLLVWRLNASKASGDRASEPLASSSATVAHEEAGSSPEERPREEKFDGKTLKKTAKVEQKRLKKEAKAEKKKE